jgi:hypothetical protein
VSGVANGASGVWLTVQRTGAPTTSTFNGLGDNFFFNVQSQINFMADRPLFVGDALNLQAIPPSADATLAFVQAEVSSTIPFAMWYQGVAGAGSATLSFSGM